MYPDGFDDPRMVEVAKKHKLVKMKEYANECFAIDKFEDPERVIEDFTKMISRASVVSVFEKTAFRNLVKESEMMFKIDLADSLREMLYGNQRQGFEAMIDCLSGHKLAKWTILTVILLYIDPMHEVFIKPTTVKNVIKYYELEGIKYTPKANYEFYQAYRNQFIQMRKKVHPSLGKDNASFSGFLMMAMELS